MNAKWRWLNDREIDLSLRVKSFRSSHKDLRKEQSLNNELRVLSWMIALPRHPLFDQHPSSLHSPKTIKRQIFTPTTHSLLNLNEQDSESHPDFLIYLHPGHQLEHTFHSLEIHYSSNRLKKLLLAQGQSIQSKLNSAKLGVHPMGTTTGKYAEGLSAEVERSFGKRKASDEVPLSTGQPQKRLSLEDHFSRDEVVQALVERIDSLVAENRDLELRATDTDSDAKASENEGNLIKNAFLELELEETKYLVEDKEGDIAGLEAEIEDLESQLQKEIDKRRGRGSAFYEVQSLIEKLREVKDRVMTLEAQIEKAEQRVNVRDELLESIQSHGRQLSETIRSGVAQLGKCDGCEG